MPKTRRPKPPRSKIPQVAKDLAEKLLLLGGEIAMREKWPTFPFEAEQFYTWLWKLFRDSGPDEARRGYGVALAWMKAGHALEKGDPREHGYRKYAKFYLEDVKRFCLENETLIAKVGLEALHAKAHPKAGALKSEPAVPTFLK